MRFLRSVLQLVHFEQPHRHRVNFVSRVYSQWLGRSPEQCWLGPWYISGCSKHYVTLQLERNASKDGMTTNKGELMWNETSIRRLSILEDFKWNIKTSMTGEQLTVSLLTMRARMRCPNGSLSLSGAQLHFIAILFPDFIWTILIGYEVRIVHMVSPPVCSKRAYSSRLASSHIALSNSTFGVVKGSVDIFVPSSLHIRSKVTCWPLGEYSGNKMS